MDMFSEKPGTELDLLAMYNFRSHDISSAHGGKVRACFHSWRKWWICFRCCAPGHGDRGCCADMMVPCDA